MMKIMKIKVSPEGDLNRFEDEGRTIFLPTDECTESASCATNHAHDLIKDNWRVISADGPVEFEQKWEVSMSARERFEESLDRLLSLHTDSIYARINAGACQTDFDRRQARRLEEKFDTALEAFIEQWYRGAQ